MTRRPWNSLLQESGEHSKANIIPDRADLLLNVRSYDPDVREQILDAIERIAQAESVASRAPHPADVVSIESAPALVNDADATLRTRPALESVVGVGRVFDPGPVTGSEDVGVLATAAGAPLVFWLLGGADPALFADAAGPQEMAAIMAGLPSNHSPFYAPVPDPTIDVGVSALCAAAMEWLGRPQG